MCTLTFSFICMHECRHVHTHTHTHTYARTCTIHTPMSFASISSSSTMSWLPWNTAFVSNLLQNSPLSTKPILASLTTRDKMSLGRTPFGRQSLPAVYSSNRRRSLMDSCSAKRNKFRTLCSDYYYYYYIN